MATRDQLEKLAIRARRSAMSEATLIWTAGSAILTLLFFMMGQSVVLWLAIRTGISPTFVALFLGIGLGGCAALIHLKVAGRVISEARHAHAELLYAHEALKRTQTEQKIAAMKSDDFGRRANG